MGFQDDLQSLKKLKPYYPTFNFHCSKLQLNLEFGLGNGEITLDQYKNFNNEIENLKAHTPKLVYVEMYPIMKTNFEFFCNVEQLGSMRTYLDESYGYLNTLVKEDDGNTFLTKIIKDLLESVSNKNKEKTFELFYFFNCYVRCHDFSALAKLSKNDIVVIGNTYHYVISELITEMTSSDIKVLQVFGNTGNFKLDANVIATVVTKILTEKDSNTVEEFIVTVIKTYYSKSKIDAVRILNDLAKYYQYYFKTESDYSEVFRIIEMIRKYSTYNVRDIVGDKLVDELIDYIYKYFENFEDFDCYNFIVKNQMYFSNASDGKTIRSTKIKIKELLDKCNILDYDGILKQ